MPLRDLDAFVAEIDFDAELAAEGVDVADVGRRAAVVVVLLSAADLRCAASAMTVNSWPLESRTC